MAAPMESYYDCFLCGTTQNSLIDFGNHLQTFLHIETLASRNLISKQHFDLLVKIDQFRFLDSISPNLLELGCDDKGTGSSNPGRLKDHPEIAAEPSQKGLPQRGKKQNEAVSSEPVSKAKLNAFHCQLCKVRLSGLNSVFEHEKGAKHTKEAEEALDLSAIKDKMFKCFACKEFFPNGNAVAKHVKKFHKDGDSSCGDVFLFQMNNLFECVLCSKSSSDCFSLAGHLRSANHLSQEAEHPEMTSVAYLICSACNCGFNQLELLSAHAESKAHKLKLSRVRKSNGRKL